MSITTVGKLQVERKLLLAEPRILANNRALVTTMLEYAKPIVVAATPIGPGHFGYHGRDTVKVEVHSKGIKTLGSLRGSIQLYWREFGTRSGFRRGKARLTAHQSRLASTFGGGERAFMTAHKAVGATKRFISFYYGGMAKWWRL